MQLLASSENCGSFDSAPSGRFAQDDTVENGGNTERWFLLFAEAALAFCLVFLADWLRYFSASLEAGQALGWMGSASLSSRISTGAPISIKKS